MTDRQFVEQVFKDVVPEWGPLCVGDNDRDGFYDLQPESASDPRISMCAFAKGQVMQWRQACDHCAEWLAGQLLNRKCLIHRGPVDNSVYDPKSGLEFSNTDYRTALLSAAKALIEEKQCKSP
jgi:hypothetical protein